MKLGKLKYALIALVLFSGVAEAQLYMKHPTDVRYIGGNMTNKRPFFKTLDAALNDVKAFASAERPYTFWLVSDTINVADWDSVYQTGGLAMNDSIDVHYVAVGKIKWAGFGQGGGGSGSAVIVPPANRTTHYNLWTYTGQTGLPTWQNRMAENQDSIDLKLWELIVYTDSTYLYIENDTLKLRSSTITALVTDAGTRPDTTIISYKAENETITGTRLFNDDITIGTGSLVLASSNNNAGTARVIWSASNKPHWSGSGAVGDTSEVLMVNTDTGVLSLDSLITWYNINAAVRDSMTYKKTLEFILAPNPSHSEGKVFYDSTHHALSYHNDESEVTLNIGQELFIRVYNGSTTDTIFNGYPVYPSGVIGDETGVVSIAQADSDATSNVLGLATHDIEPETYGYITRYGYVHDINTAGFTPGGTVYLSASTAGGLTTTKPDAPNNAIPLGGVTRVDNDSGSVFLAMERFNPINGSCTLGFIDSTFIIDLAVGVPLQITNTWSNLFTDDANVTHDVTLSGDTLYLAEPGVYYFVVSFSFQGANGGIYKFTGKQDGTFVERAGRRYTSTADVGSVSFNFSVRTTTANEIVTFWVENTAGSQDATMIDGSIIVMQAR